MKAFSALAVASLLLLSVPAQAATITAFEEIGEIDILAGIQACDSDANVTERASCEDLSVAQLYMIRDNGVGGAEAPVNLAGNVPGDTNGDFGKFNTTDFSYQHDTTWLSNIIQLTKLEIWAYDVDGGNDNIYRVTISTSELLGDLDNDNNSISTTTFTANLALSAGLMTLFVDKEPNNPEENNDQINIFRSRLTFTYWDGVGIDPRALDPVATPEPGSMMLLGTGIAALVAVRLRRRKA